MQIESTIKVFDAVDTSKEHPVSPSGCLFCYYPEYNPPTLHYHSYLEIGYCERGSGIFIIDGKSISFNGQCVSIIYPGQVHIAKSTSAEKSLWHFLYIDLQNLFYNFPKGQLESLRAMSPNEFVFPCVISRQTDSVLYDIVKSIMAESATEGEDYLHAMQGLVLSMLIIHGRYMKKKNKAERNQGEMLGDIGNVINYINTNYMKKITIDELAKIGNCSRASLQRKINRFIGRPPLQYIQELRLNQAAIMLQDSQKNITEISLEVGYQTISCFNRQFLAAFGKTPSMYRKAALLPKGKNDKE